LAVLGIFTVRGLTKDQYDALRTEIDWEHNQPAGGVLHVASFDDAGNAHVADVWASAEALDDFVSSRLMPAMQRLNINPPQVQVYPVHNIDVYKAAEAHRI
jgi:hypothetical protein